MSSIKGVDNINIENFKYEYTIFCVYNGGKPFYLSPFSNIQKAKLQLYDMVELEKERGRPYYVNNDFFKNEYTSNVLGKYFCIKERKISDWVDYIELKKEKKFNNLVFFNEICK